MSQIYTVFINSGTKCCKNISIKNINECYEETLYPKSGRAFLSQWEGKLSVGKEGELCDVLQKKIFIIMKLQKHVSKSSMLQWQFKITENSISEFKNTSSAPHHEQTQNAVSYGPLSWFCIVHSADTSAGFLVHLWNGECTGVCQHWMESRFVRLLSTHFPEF